MSLTVFDENNKMLYSPNNNSANKAKIVKINNCSYAAIKPLKDKFIKLNELLKSFSQLELREYFLQRIEFKDIKLINLRKKMRII